MRILIIKPSSLGDVVHALPVLRLLKLHWPDSEIHWWLESGLVPLLADDPDLSGIFSFERNRWAAPNNWPELWRAIRHIRSERFDLAIDLQGLARSAVVAWLANADLSIGLDNPREGAREGARLYYDVIAPRAAQGTHAVDRYLAVLPQLRVPVHDRFEWLPQRPPLAAAIRQKWQLDSTRWVTLLPGARWNNKRWPAENFAELARRMPNQAADLKFAILGSKSDSGIGNAIADGNRDRCLDLTGKTSLPEMIEWIRLSELVITNDTGPMHIAAALKKPIIALFGPTDPRGTGPYGQSKNVLQLSDLPCVPCMKDTCGYKTPLACLTGIAPEMVLERARASLEISARP